MGTQTLAIGSVRMFRYAFGTLLLLAGTALLVAHGLAWLNLEPRILRALQGGAICALGTALGAVPVLVIRRMPMALSDTLLGFGNNGKIYSVPVSALPNARGDGVPITTLCDLSGGTPGNAVRILHYFAGNGATSLLLATSAGYGFVAKAGDMSSRLKGGKAFITLDDGDVPLEPKVIPDTASAVACLTEGARLLVFGLLEMKTLSKGGTGVKLIELEGKDKLLAVQPISQRGVLVSGIGRAAKPQDASLGATALADHIGKRAKKGKPLAAKLKPVSMTAIG